MEYGVRSTISSIQIQTYRYHRENIYDCSQKGQGQNRTEQNAISDLLLSLSYQGPIFLYWPVILGSGVPIFFPPHQLSRH